MSSSGYELNVESKTLQMENETIKLIEGGQCE